MGSVQDIQGLPSCVCNQCKRRKKKCDKRLPVCGRCSRLRIHCLYAPDSWKETSSIPANSYEIKHGKSSPLQSHVMAASCGTCIPLPEMTSPFSFTMTLPGHSVGLSLPESERRVLDFDEQLTMQACEIMRRNGDDIGSVCERYFHITEKWLPIIDRREFFTRLRQLQTSPSAAFSTLALSVCLVAQASLDGPGRNGMIESHHYTTKCFWSLLQSSGRLSVEVVQAGLLITAYEYSQSLSEASILSIGICARMGYALELHKTIQPGVRLENISKQDLEERRRVWWAIFILERAMAIDQAGDRIPFACQTPHIDHQLPSDCISKDQDNAAIDPSAGYTPVSFELSSATSTRLSPFPQEAQAAYLLSQVLDHITNDALTDKARQDRIEQLDNSLQSLLMAMLEPLSGYGKGDYCGSYSICISALFSLHQSHLSRKSWPSPADDSSSRSLLALEAASRMLLDACASSVIGKPLDWDTLAPWSINTLYAAGLVRIKLSRGFPDEEQGESELSPVRTYLRHFESRYRIAAACCANVEKALAYYNSSSHA